MPEFPPDGPERRGTAEIVDEAVQNVAKAIDDYRRAVVELRIGEREINDFRERYFWENLREPKQRYRLPDGTFSELSYMFNTYIKEKSESIRLIAGKKPFYKFKFEETLDAMAMHATGRKLTDDTFIADEIKADRAGLLVLNNRETGAMLVLKPLVEFNLQLAGEDEI